MSKSQEHCEAIIQKNIRPHAVSHTGTHLTPVPVRYTSTLFVHR